MDIAASNTVIASVAAALGLLFCFFGYRLFKAAVTVCGFALGVLVVGGLATVFTSVIWIVALCGGAGGVGGALLFRGIVNVGVFVAGAAGGGLLGAFVAASGVEPLYVGLVTAGLALLCGFVALKAQRITFSIATALVGASAVTGACVFFAYGAGAPDAFFDRLVATAPLPVADWIALAAGGLLAFCGAAVQLRGKKRKDDERDAG